MPQSTCAASVTGAARPYAPGKTRLPPVVPEGAYCIFLLLPPAGV